MVLESKFLATADSATLLGVSGMGKTTVTKACLARYPAVIEHDKPIPFKQIVWIRLECPTTGSPKQLCIAFFQEVDRLLRSKYYKDFGGMSVDHMLLHVAQICQIHAVGVVVIDEIQWLTSSITNKQHLLNFLTGLVNVVSVPVLMVGTMRALPLFASAFRNARRAQGVGSTLFERLPNGKEWRFFFDSLWQFQWTRNFTPATDEMCNALWEESQGIIDIAVKVFMLSQIKLMRLSDVKPAKEVISIELISHIMKNDLSIVGPLLQALRENDRVALSRFDDLYSLNDVFESVIASQMPDSPSAYRSTLVRASKSLEVVEDDEAFDKFVAGLVNFGVARDVAEAVVTQAVADTPTRDSLAVMSKVQKILAGGNVRARLRPTKPGKIAGPDHNGGDLRTVRAMSDQERADYISANSTLGRPRVEPSDG